MPATVASSLGDTLFTRREHLLPIPNPLGFATMLKRSTPAGSRQRNIICKLVRPTTQPLDHDPEP